MTTSLIKPPPAPKPLPFEVSAVIEDVARRYLEAVRAADLTHDALQWMDRAGPGYLTAFDCWVEHERVARLARWELADAIGPGPGCWPLGDVVIRNVNRLGGGAELRIDPGTCPWQRKGDDLGGYEVTRGDS